MSYESLWQLYPFAREQLVNAKTGIAKKLKGPECRVLEVLIQSKGEVVSKKDILSKVWGDRIVSDASLTQSIAQLRLALGDNGKEQKFIKTVPYEGYLLFENVVELVASEHEVKAIDLTGEEKNDTPLKDKIEEKENHTDYNYAQQIKILFILLFALIFACQATDLLHRLTFSWNVQLDKWVEIEEGTMTSFYLENPASLKLYNYLNTESHHLNTSPITELLISTGVSNYYLSCMYVDTNTGDQGVKNMTFSLKENFYFIGVTVNEFCR
ncbi:transcriptional regulator [Vibrio sp. Of7-15]|uniref:winged helix-turn-helix domain-containing protein n=1 Tax=Vibrio sp. Of7-15 TaxID=2724879 RepID=UPI001EF18A21|nr:transcriptional regulator [Vibrio sp. Of7-15]MCG7499863.1 transcriptional regulator [Vibrio sp. Of7-15]